MFFMMFFLRGKGTENFGRAICDVRFATMPETMGDGSTSLTNRAVGRRGGDVARRVCTGGDVFFFKYPNTNFLLTIYLYSTTNTSKSKAFHPILLSKHKQFA
jgi:hypothetical protein